MLNADLGFDDLDYHMLLVEIEYDFDIALDKSDTDELTLHRLAELVVGASTFNAATGSSS